MIGSILCVCVFVCLFVCLFVCAWCVCVCVCGRVHPRTCVVNSDLSLLLGKTCCLHDGEGEKNGAITLFNKHILVKCKEILIVRKEQKLKYSNIELPIEVDCFNGFHIDCYRKFTALSKYQREKLLTSKKSNDYEACMSTNRLMCSDISSPKPSTSSGVFQKLCLFCDRHTFKHGGIKQTHFMSDRRNPKQHQKICTMVG